MNDLDDGIDVEDRLRAVKRAARRRPVPRHPALLTSAGAAATLFIYLRWRSARQHGRRRVGSYTGRESGSTGSRRRVGPHG